MTKMSRASLRLQILLVFAIALSGTQSSNRQRISSNTVKRQRIIAPIRLKPGETPIQKPGWTHCVTDMKVYPAWRKLRSPDYPKLAPIQMQCSWILEAPIGWRVMVTFKDLHLSPPSGDGPEKSCQTSYVKIIDMTAQKSQGKFCGNQPPGDYVSLGSVLRIDLQGDKSPKPRRGFIVMYTMTKESPGFRPQRKVSSASESSPGKVNLNQFKSTQQKLINSAANNKGLPKRRHPVPKRLIYASDTTTLKPTTTTVANEGWIGDVALPKGPSPSKRTASGAKFQARSSTNQKSSNGNRIRATNQRGSQSDNEAEGNDGRIQDTSSYDDDDWTGVGRNPAPVEEGEVPRIYGQHMQPFDTTPKKKPKESGGNYVVMKKEGISTEQLIIIIVGVLACILLVVAVFLLKRFFFDRHQKEKKKEKKSEAVTENPYNVNREATLPGMPRTGSLHSLASMQDNLHTPRHLSVAPSDRHMTSARNTMTNGTMTRHQTLVAKHEAVYRNQRAMMKNATAPPEFHGRSLQRRGSNINRPLPPIPTEKKDFKPNDVDEDYCSGSDEDPDVTTMKREMSDWEIQQERRNKISNRYKL